MDNKQSLEDKPTTNAAVEEILSDEELDSVAGGAIPYIPNLHGPNLNGDIWGGGTGRGSDSVAGGDSIRFGGTGRG